MVDIIIPAYNCSKTLPKLLASIGAQTKPEKCIVTIVDDCSTEDIKPIIKDFKKYFNIKLQYIKLKENLKWPGLVRQEGLNRTNSPYVMFLDSDDFLSPRAVELANQEMRHSNSDVIIGHFYGEDPNHQWSLYDEDMTTWLHGNIYKRDFLNKNDIHFEPLYNEDGSFNTECYLLAETISYLPEPIYFWSSNSKSVTKGEYFKLNNLPFFVKSLRITYEKLFQKSKKQLIYTNLGKHIFNFYKMLDQHLYTINKYGNKIDKEIKKLFTIELEEFAKFLKDEKLTKEQKELVRKTFVDELMKRDRDGDYIPSIDFWNNFGFDIALGGLWE